MPLGEGSQAFGMLVRAEVGHCGKHIGRKVIMDQSTVPLVMCLVIGTQVCGDLMQVISVMHMFHLGTDWLIVSRLMGTPSHPRHEECACEKQQECVASHGHAILSNSENRNGHHFNRAS